MSIRETIEKLPPAYFALVMATGIVSIASHEQGFKVVASALFWFDVAAYGVLWVLTLARLVFAPKTIYSDLSDLRRGAGFFTMPAGTFVLGSDLLILYGETDAALGLWAVGVALWIITMYAYFALAAVKQNKPVLAHGISGVSMVAIVATQGVAVLAVSLAGNGIASNTMMQIGLLFFLCGAVLYVMVLALLLQRLLFEPLSPDDLKSSYWVSMGVEAISALAGALLVLHAAASPLVELLKAPIELLTLTFWAMACWWIPLLLLLGFWRYVIKRMPVSYAASYWSMVFPLGMFTVATYVLGGLPHLAWMLNIPIWSVYISLVAWALTAIGGTLNLVGLAHSRRPTGAPK